MAPIPPQWPPVDPALLDAPESDEPAERRADGTFAAGVSGNPLGKKPGTRSARTLLAEAFNVDAAAIGKVVTARALAGDMQACGLVLQRLMPPLRPKAERTPFKLDTTRPLSECAAAVVQAVADGSLSGEEAQVVLGCLQTYAALRQGDELEARIRALEGRANAAAPRGGVIEMEDQ